MLKSSIPGWFGWPSKEPAPSCSWLPGPVLRVAILGLTGLFLSTSLTIDYVSSVSLFLLAILGLYIGLRRGFINGISSAEKIMMLTFSAYPIVAIVSYLAGTHTNVGFRFLGRDLRFLLFIPVYLAIRWSKPRSNYIGWALFSGAAGACITSFLQSQPWPSPLPHGVTGTHITFGDLSILTGFISAAFLLKRPVIREGQAPKRPKSIKDVSAVIAIMLAVLTGVLAKARGGWLAIPVLLLVILWLPPLSTRFTRRKRLLLSASGIAFLIAISMGIPNIRNRIFQAKRNVESYLIMTKHDATHANCFDNKTLLDTLLSYSHYNAAADVQIEALPKPQKGEVESYGCKGRYVIAINKRKGGDSPARLSIYRGNNPSLPKRHQSTSLLIKTSGRVLAHLGWKGRWTKIGDTDGWREISFSQYEKGTPSINLAVFEGSARLIPVQKPHGVYAYALADTSVGHRFEMWRAAWALFRKHVWLGAGTGAFYPLAEDALGSSAMRSIAGKYEHAHNQYLTNLSTQGVAGTLAVVLLLMCPWLVFRNRHVASYPSHFQTVGALITSGMAIFSLTETMFVHSLVISWFVTLTAATLASAEAKIAPELPIEKRKFTSRRFKLI